MERIHDRSTFLALRRSRARASAGAVSVVRVDRDARTAPALAFAIGRNVGGAVVRNRLRRQLREEFRDLAPPSGAYLVTVRPGAGAVDAAELRRCLRAAVAGVVGEDRP